MRAASKNGRRWGVDPVTSERDYSQEEFVFLKAMQDYKHTNRRPFPTLSEMLEILHSLGYRKVAEPTVLPGLSGRT
jgi:hypothetical protein